MNYTVVDTVTGQEFPSKDILDIEAAVTYILDGQELTEYDEEQIMVLLYETKEWGASYSQALGIEVVPHV